MSRKYMGTRIKSARERKGLSQAGLGKALGVTQSAVGQWETKGGTQPNMDNLVHMAEILETTVEYLAEGKASPFGEPPKIDASAPVTERIAFALEEIAAEVRHMRQTLDRIASTDKPD
jgi:transcriptional regulator with XRE-family HTH domain